MRGRRFCWEKSLKLLESRDTNEPLVLCLMLGLQMYLPCKPAILRIVPAFCLNNVLGATFWGKLFNRPALIKETKKFICSVSSSALAWNRSMCSTITDLWSTVPAEFWVPSQWSLLVVVSSYINCSNLYLIFIPFSPATTGQAWWLGLPKHGKPSNSL